MNRSKIVHGPAGCGKTTNAKKIAARFGLSKIVDDWNVSKENFDEYDTLYLTEAEPNDPRFSRYALPYDYAVTF